MKSRYLEPKAKAPPKDSTPHNHDKLLLQQRRKVLISSSDSSRTSSPAMKRAAAEKKLPLANVRLSIKRDSAKTLSNDSLTEDCCSSKTLPRKDVISKSLTRPESPMYKRKTLEKTSKKKPVVVVGKLTKEAVSMSTDSLTNTTDGTPTRVSSKVSPNVVRREQPPRTYEKRTTPVQQQQKQRSPLVVTKQARATTRSIESSTAASRSRAAAITAYHGSPNLR